jgi:hypothetical protein
MALNWISDNSTTEKLFERRHEILKWHYFNVWVLAYLSSLMECVMGTKWKEGTGRRGNITKYNNKWKNKGHLQCENMTDETKKRALHYKQYKHIWVWGSQCGDYKNAMFLDVAP